MAPSHDAYAYMSRRKDIDNLLSELQEALKIKDDVFREKEDWEHVVDLNNIREHLTNALKYTKASLDKW